MTPPHPPAAGNDGPGPFAPGAAHVLVPLAVCAALLVWTMGLGGDAWTTALFFDPGSRTFPLRHDPALVFWLHTAVKPPVVALGVTALLVFLAGFRVRRLRPWRRASGYCACAMALGAGVIPVLKSLSWQSCPYDLLAYGGSRPHIGLFDAVPAGAVPGRSWPGAHAATAFCLFGFYFAARSYGRTRLAWGILAGIIAFGIVLSLVQVARGAHFLSHQVWTAGLDWGIAFTLHRLCWRSP